MKVYFARFRVRDKTTEFGGPPNYVAQGIVQFQAKSRRQAERIPRARLRDIQAKLPPEYQQPPFEVDPPDSVYTSADDLMADSLRPVSEKDMLDRIVL